MTEVQERKYLARLKKKAERRNSRKEKGNQQRSKLERHVCRKDRYIRVDEDRPS